MSQELKAAAIPDDDQPASADLPRQWWVRHVEIDPGAVETSLALKITGLTRDVLDETAGRELVAEFKGLVEQQFYASPEFLRVCELEKKLSGVLGDDAIAERARVLEEKRQALWQKLTGPKLIVGLAELDANAARFENIVEAVRLELEEAREEEATALQRIADRLFPLLADELTRKVEALKQQLTCNPLFAELASATHALSYFASDGVRARAVKVLANAKAAA